jgi:hypothetical protein
MSTPVREESLSFSVNHDKRGGFVKHFLVVRFFMEERVEPYSTTNRILYAQPR